MIEKKFQQFRKSITPKQFNSLDFLASQADKYESDDPALAKRIRLRIQNLKKQQQKVALHPEIEKESTVENPKSVSSNNDKVTANDKSKNDVVPSSWQTVAGIWQKLKAAPFIALVVLPTLLFTFYQIVWATERYESQAKVTVQQPDSTATMDASMAILSGLGVSSSSTSDTELIKTYIYSNDMLKYLEKEVGLTSHYTNSNIDVFSRFEKDGSQEKLLEYYLEHVSVEIDDKSGVVSIYTQSFTPEFSQQLTNKIVKRAEWYINSIGHQLAQAQLTFIRGEHALVENKLNTAQTELLTFQQRYNLLDPTAEGAAMQQIAYQLEGQISAKEAELKGLRHVMSASAPRVIATQNELNALRAQLTNERERLAQTGDESLPVSEIMAKFADLKIKVELALQAFTSSQVSLEKSRIEAYRQLKYLVVVEEATLPQDSKYPDVFYNISLFIILTSMLFAIGRIVQSTIRELK